MIMFGNFVMVIIYTSSRTQVCACCCLSPSITSLSWTTKPSSMMSSIGSTIPTLESRIVNYVWLIKQFAIKKNVIAIWEFWQWRLWNNATHEALDEKIP